MVSAVSIQAHLVAGVRHSRQVISVAVLIQVSFRGGVTEGREHAGAYVGGVKT